VTYLALELDALGLGLGLALALALASLALAGGARALVVADRLELVRLVVILGNALDALRAPGRVLGERALRGDGGKGGLL
jgi:NAD(P)-dependent dehydrogenase (short-subunit alcohol dehydrogenase family)